MPKSLLNEVTCPPQGEEIGGPLQLVCVEFIAQKSWLNTVTMSARTEASRLRGEALGFYSAISIMTSFRRMNGSVQGSL